MRICQNGSVMHVSFSSSVNGNVLLSVYDLNGSIVHSVNIRKRTGSMQYYDFSTIGISKGYYVVKVRSGDVVLKKGVVLTGR